jgi:hypothetical protein
MTREEYLNKMQAYREELQEACKKNRETLDKLAQEHKLRQREEQERYDKAVKWQRDEHTENQHEVERKMHELKVQWAIEHPIEEVKVVE